MVIYSKGDVFNAYGGSLPDSYGIATEQKQTGIRTGIRKINQGTDSHLAWTAAARQSLVPGEVEPSIATKAAMSAMREIVAPRMQEFGAAGQAGPR